MPFRRTDFAHPIPATPQFDALFSATKGHLVVQIESRFFVFENLNIVVVSKFAQCAQGQAYLASRP